MLFGFAREHRGTGWVAENAPVTVTHDLADIDDNLPMCSVRGQRSSF